MVYVNGTPAVESVHEALHAMHLETDLELINSVLGELMDEVDRVPLRVALTHLQDAVSALGDALLVLERKLTEHNTKWFASRRSFRDTNALARVRQLKREVDHRFRRLMDVVSLGQLQ